MAKIEEIKTRLNIQRVGQLDLKKEEIDIVEIDPLVLINHSRFDIMAKYIYATFKHNKLQSNWGYRLYEDHMWVFNKYNEDDGSGKKGIKSFVRSFNSTLESIQRNGFDKEISLLPLNTEGIPIDGAHRLTAALLYKHKINTIKVSSNTINYNYEFFKRKGLLNKWGDAMAYEYCKLKKQTHIVILFPIAMKKKVKIIETLKKYGSIYYEKDITLVNRGQQNLIKLLFKDNNRKEDLKRNMKEDDYFKGKNTVNALVFEKKDSISYEKVKEDLEKLFKQDLIPFYINERHDDTIRLTQSLLNENSLHFLNYAKLNSFESFESLKDEYRENSEKYGFDKESLCVISDAVLAAYGIYETRNIEFILNVSSSLEKVNLGFNGLNPKNKLFNKPLDDIIYNPENHFYFDGIKFASLNIVRQMMKRQGLKKEKVLIKKMERLIKISKKSNKVFWKYNIKKKILLIKFKIVDKRILYRKLIKF